MKPNAAVTAPGTAPDRHTKILLDAPSVQPELGFQRTAAALARVVQDSSPRFSVGIFGDWGSGKTTLMDSIRRELPETIATVSFNAWRFEREPQLLVPLLDTVRTALVDWAAGRNETTRERVQRVARRVGRVVRALVSGLSVEVGLPPATLTYDAGAAVDALAADAPDAPKSLYVAAFRELSDAFAEFTRDGADRVVVFVDDLDRCLPANALDVLESIKLFFDLPGFVFVVGLDEAVVQRAVRTRFPDERTDGSESAPSPQQGKLERDYVEKIFQVPYRLPPIVAGQLGALLESMYAEAELPATQLADFRHRVAPYLQFVAVDRRINPREVKRFLNTYTLQMLVRPELDRDTVLALQTLLFRYDWRTLYDAILTDSTLFIDALQRYRGGEDLAFEDLSPELTVLPAELGEYLRQPAAEALTRPMSLDPYMSSLEASSPIPTWLIECYHEIGRVRAGLRRLRAVDPITLADARTLAVGARDAADKITAMSSRYMASQGRESLNRLLDSIKAAAAELEGPASDPDASEDGLVARVTRSVATIADLANRVYRELRNVRDAVAPAAPA